VRSLLNRAVGFATLTLFCVAPWIPGCKPDLTGLEALEGTGSDLVSAEKQEKELQEIDAKPKAAEKLSRIAESVHRRIVAGSLLGVAIAGGALFLVPRFARLAATLGAGSALTLNWISGGWDAAEHFQLDRPSPPELVLWEALPVGLTVLAVLRTLQGRGLVATRALALLAIPIASLPTGLCWGARATCLLLGSALWLEVMPRARIRACAPSRRSSRTKPSRISRRSSGLTPRTLRGTRSPPLAT
jgi:hypothetical protein